MAHKELIDLIVAYKDQYKDNALESVTKTKIRGVLALLKQADILLTVSPGGLPVQVTLSQHIYTFADLRYYHDRYLVRASIDTRSNLAPEHWDCLIWNNLSPESKSGRFHLLEHFTFKVEHFLACDLLNCSKLTSSSTVDSLATDDDSDCLSEVHTVQSCESFTAFHCCNTVERNEMFSNTMNTDTMNSIIHELKFGISDTLSFSERFKRPRTLNLDSEWQQHTPTTPTSISAASTPSSNSNISFLTTSTLSPACIDAHASFFFSYSEEMGISQFGALTPDNLPEKHVKEYEFIPMQLDFLECDPELIPFQSRFENQRLSIETHHF